MEEYQVIVIGGGPAGLMAAGQSAACGATTLLLEKMDRPGCKLRLTGKGRCNLTNVAPLEDFIRHFNPNGRFLHHAFSRFFTDELIAFLDKQGVETVVERGGRVFPESNDAQMVVNALTQWIRKCGVTLLTRSSVERLWVEQGQIVGVHVMQTPSSRRKAREKDVPASLRYRAHKVILATGGASYPGTGSTGDGYRMAEAVGHTIIPIRPALVPLITSGDTAKRLQGLSLRNVNVRMIVDGKTAAKAFGEMLFTHFGLSGPIILSLSRQVVDALHEHRQVEFSIDLKPALDDAKLDARLLRDLNSHGRQHYRTLLKELLPQKLIPVCAELTGISLDKEASQITSKERRRLRLWLKDFRFLVTGHQSFSQAIITAGGVDTRQVDPRSMASRLIDGLYFAGEVLNVDADTGGYNLQAAFSTGWLAGHSAAS
jgi:predicted Rossmann fold flavoprotein